MVTGMPTTAGIYEFTVNVRDSSQPMNSSTTHVTPTVTPLSERSLSRFSGGLDWSTTQDIWKRHCPSTEPFGIDAEATEVGLAINSSLALRGRASFRLRLGSQKLRDVLYQLAKRAALQQEL
jgi:hypothetical protein